MTLDILVHIRPYVELLITICANPLMVVLVVGMNADFESVGFKVAESFGYNSIQILWRPYLLLCLILGILWKAFIYMVLTVGKDLSLWDFVWSQDTTIFGWVVYLVSLCCLCLFFRDKGIEGNIVGFIFAPIMLICAAYQLIHHFIWIYQQI